MSVETLAAVASLAVQRPDLKVSPTQRLVLYALALRSLAGIITVAYPGSLHALVQLTGLSERAIRDALHQLERMRLIEPQEGGKQVMFPPIET